MRLVERLKRKYNESLKTGIGIGISQGDAKQLINLLTKTEAKKKQKPTFSITAPVIKD